MQWGAAVVILDIEADLERSQYPHGLQIPVEACVIDLGLFDSESFQASCDTAQHNARVVWESSDGTLTQ